MFDKIRKYQQCPSSASQISFFPFFVLSLPNLTQNFDNWEDGEEVVVVVVEGEKDGAEDMMIIEEFLLLEKGRNSLFIQIFRLLSD